MILCSSDLAYFELLQNKIKKKNTNTRKIFMYELECNKT